RRRHTRSYGDWSSDVCSSDLGARECHGEGAGQHERGVRDPEQEGHARQDDEAARTRLAFLEELRIVLECRSGDPQRVAEDVLLRSEERRVGKEGHLWLWEGEI